MLHTFLWFKSFNETLIICTQLYGLILFNSVFNGILVNSIIIIWCKSFKGVNGKANRKILKCHSVWPTHGDPRSDLNP